ncbi:DUF7352 domain-containing protein [Glutamicibacter soli]|uniref:DUF7352 domain-containing protein n=1 Tax=Glutamicibacter soli TaxID=453836 RepID=UPI003C74D30A
MNRRIYRHELKVNDQAHEIPAGKIVHFTEYRNKHITHEKDRVEVWVETQLVADHTIAKSIGRQRVQIFGTGQSIPDGAEHLASCLAGSFVWHLYRLPEPPAGANQC